MTFVIIGGGIDLSVGAIVALSSVWCTTLATQTMAEDTHWIVMVCVALAVGAGCGLVNGVLIAYGKVVAVHRDPGDAGQRPRAGRDHLATARPRSSTSRASRTSSPPTILGIPC